MRDDTPDLRARTRRYALATIRLSATMSRTEEAFVIRRQMLRSGTSVGAQYREACRARSDAEFVSKLEGAMQELEETLYWLELLKESGIRADAAIDAHMDESEQLIRILTSIVRRRKPT